MGSSAKKKNEKKKDFKKPKLKVGKARAKPTNFTDTSFTSKSIVLAHQSLSTSAPSPASQFSHHLSLLSSRSATQRRDSLAYLTTSIASRPVDTPLPQPIGVFLPKLCPLILDESNGVRGQLLRLFGAISPQEIESQIGQILLYIRAGLTHLAADIRSSATDVFLWAVKTCPTATVCCPGGWVKTLGCLLTVLHWHAPAVPKGTKGASSEGGSWTSSRAPALGNTGSEGKLAVKTLNALSIFLRAGLVHVSALNEPDCSQGMWPFPIRHIECHMMPKQSNAYGYLNLFGPSRDEEGEMYAEISERQKVFSRKFQKTIDSGVASSKKEGGELGRAAAEVWKSLVEGMDGFESDE